MSGMTLTEALLTQGYTFEEPSLWSRMKATDSMKDN